ncbi:hypothetical protein OIU34_23340 [Pararhizobium sp. BT-229]|nr:hypothetical protein [Pararhizobium sp. BT-229]MCV9964831.1 hypothetical protein [Pararhizobium sp. BT-229]
MNMFVEGALIPIVTDDIDFSDFPDCGFGEVELEEAVTRTSPLGGR